MDLWILNQDRMDLVKVDKIGLKYNDKKTIMANYVFDEYHCIYDALGTYETEERALEVMNEICQYKDKLDKAYFSWREESEFVSSIYKMPKE